MKKLIEYIISFAVGLAFVLFILWLFNDKPIEYPIILLLIILYADDFRKSVFKKPRL